MNYIFFLQPFFISFLVSAFLLAVFIFLNNKRIFINPRNSERHLHKKNIPRLGGAAIIISFIAALLLDNRLIIEAPLIGVLIASGAILIFGIIDDFRELSWKTQLFFQIVIVAFVYSMGVRLAYISNPFGGIIQFDSTVGYAIGFVVAIAWVVFIMNAMNWIDGIDGASSGVAIICALAIFFLSLKPEVNQPPIGIITAALVGGLLAFLLFNFHPAKIMAGTSGAMFMGFVLAILAIFAGAKIATTLLVLAIPAIDALWVVFERYRSKKSIFLADRNHLHFRLLEIGWSQRKICAFYYSVTIFLAILALNTRAIGKLATILVFGVVMLVVLAIISKKLSHKI